MKSQYVNRLQEGDTVNDYFVAVRKDLRPKQSGGHFLGMVFKDKTGDIGGVLWNNAAEVARLFELGDVVNVRGRVNVYQGNLQIQVEQVLPLRDGEFSADDLVSAAEDTGEDLKRLRGVLGTIENPWLKRLVTAFFEDKAFMERFTAAAAAKKWHHACRGGLVRHCYEMGRIAQTMCELFPELDRDLLLAAVFLHDIGKLYEMSHELFVDYTTEGKLIGHVQIGVDMVQDRIREIEGFPRNLRMELAHCILSHHGEFANGAPVLPKTLEAIVLYHIDNLDAQTAAVARVIEETRDKRQAWSEFLPLINRVIYAKER